MANALEERLAAIEEQETSPIAAVAAYKELILGDTTTSTQAIKAKETAISRVCDLYVKLSDAAALRTFLTELRPLFMKISVVKTAKIIRSVIDCIAKIPNSIQIQVTLSHSIHLDVTATPVNSDGSV